MRVQLAQQAKAILGQSELVIITERADDVALLIGQMIKMGLPDVLDRHIPRHWTQCGLSWGWTAVIWLASIVTEGAHRKGAVETYLKGMHHTLSCLTVQDIEPLDFSDDRLSHLLKHLSKAAYWHTIERDLNERSIELYALSQDVIRCDATTVSGDHEGTAEGLVQFGHSKDDPARPQIKVMLGSLAPLGMPLATDVLSGERADDGLSLPIMERIRTGLQTPGLLFVGDCKMSALETRPYLARHQDLYLSPLPLTGTTAEAMDAWITAGGRQGERGALARIVRTDDRGHPVLAAEGYEFERPCEALDEAGDVAAWPERVLVVRSPLHADHQAAGLENRRSHAETKLAALTPPRGRGKRHITDEATLVAAIARVLPEHRVDGLLSVPWEKQVEQTTQDIGRGRGSGHREKRVLEKTRYHMTHSVRQGATIAALRQRFGRPLSPTRHRHSCLCRRRCCAIATNTGAHASSTASRAACIAHRYLSSATTKARASRPY